MLEKIYINRISHRLELFKDLGNNIYACRCMKCGDSKNKKNKKRFYFFQQNGKFFVKCFNCGYTNSFVNFLKEFDFNIFSELKLENLKNNFNFKEEIILNTNITKNSFNNISNFTNDLETIEKTKNNNIINYIKYRKIPEEYYTTLFAITDIKKFASNFEKYKDKVYLNSDSVLIPFYNRSNVANYYQTRYIDNNIKQRFLTFSINDDNNIFNENKLDFTSRVTILEGPFDSLFVNNSCAIGGINNTNKINYLKSLTKNIRIIVDNDYNNNQEVKKFLIKYIDEGYSVVIYDRYFKGIKDINEAIIKNKFDYKTINEYLDSRTFSGLSAKLELASQERKK